MAFGPVSLHSPRFRSLLKYFMQFKENYFGYYQKFTDVEAAAGRRAHMNNHKSPGSVAAGTEDEEKFDPREYRPMAIKVSLTLHDIHAHLAKVPTHFSLTYILLVIGG